MLPRLSAHLRALVTLVARATSGQKHQSSSRRPTISSARLLVGRVLSDIRDRYRRLFPRQHPNQTQFSHRNVRRRPHDELLNVYCRTRFITGRECQHPGCLVSRRVFQGPGCPTTESKQSSMWGFQNYGSGIVDIDLM